MSGSLTVLAIAVGAFVVSHLALSSQPLRDSLVRSLGIWGFRGAYSLIALLLLVWAVIAYTAAPVVVVWDPPTAMRHVSLSLMPFACLLLVCGYLTPNPTAVGSDERTIIAAGPAGIQAVTRHPILWAIALWGISHLFANGDAAGMLLFGALTLLAIGGAAHLDRRKRRELGEAWIAYAERTSFLPLAAWVAGRVRPSLREIGIWRIVLGLALYGILLALHPWLFGVNPLAR